MPYDPDITNEAFEDVERLIDSLPAERRSRAIDALDEAFIRLAANPRLASKGVIGRPTFFFRFEIDGVGYHWAATFCYSEDEKKIIITQVYRPLT
jgi:hypothetical protein